MRFARAFALGLKRAWRHPGLVLLTYLVSLIPALLLAARTAPGLRQALDHSLFASRAMEGWGDAVLLDYLRTPANPPLPDLGAAMPYLALTLLAQILLAAGTVEVLLERAPRKGLALWQGMGRWGWRFLRSALWMGIAVVVLLVLLGVVYAVIAGVAEETRNGNLLVAARIAVPLLGLLLFAPLDLAYDLSRIAASSHGDRRTFVGLFKALGHVLTRPGFFLPFYLSLVLLALGLHAGWLALTLPWTPATLGQVMLLAAGQQAVMLLRAGLRVSFWGAEVSYYLGAGEPPWCGSSNSPWWK